MASARVILAIETSNPSAWEEGQRSRPGVALARENDGAIEVLGVAALVDNPGEARGHEDRLMPAIAGLVEAAKLRPRDVTDVFVSAGPGGYTGVRLAITTAKVIAEAMGARAVAVPSARVTAFKVVRERPELGTFVVAISSKGTTTFATVFDVVEGVARERGNGVVVDATSLSRLVRESGARALVGDRFLPDGIREAAGVEVVAPEFDPVECVRAGVGVEAVDPVALAPIYAREPEAVTKWRELEKGRG